MDVVVGAVQGVLWLFGRRDAVDLTLGDPAAAEIRVSLQNGRWADVAGLFRKQGREQREFLLTVMTHWPGRPEWLDGWTAASPSSPDAWLISGVHAMRWAWEARTGSVASMVSGRRWNRFFERLEIAQEHLLRAAELAPDDPLPWAAMVTVAKGQQWPLADARVVLDHAVERDPECRPAYSAFLDYSAARWSGEANTSLTVAREFVAAHPTSFLDALIAEAHFQRSIDLGMESELEADGYFKRDEVRTELTRLHHVVLRWPLSPRRICDHNVMACCLTDSGLYAGARMHFDLLGDRNTEFPWKFRMLGARGAFVKARKRAARG